MVKGNWILLLQFFAHARVLVVCCLTESPVIPAALCFQDLVDISSGYDESDPFVDNSEAVSDTAYGFSRLFLCVHVAAHVVCSCWRPVLLSWCAHHSQFIFSSHHPKSYAYVEHVRNSTC